METSRKMLRFHWLDNFKPLTVFWSILLLVDIALVVAQRYFPEVLNTSDNFLFSANYGAIAIYLLVCGILMATSSFPLLMSFGIPRQKFYLNLIGTTVLLCAAMSLIQNIVVYVGYSVMQLSGITIEASITPFLLLWYCQWTFYLLDMFLFILLGTVFYRFGTLPGLITIAFYILVLNLVPDDLDFADNFELAASGLSNVTLSHLFLGITVVLIGIGWLLYRRAPVRTY
ncbi:hypothetical protein DFP94_104153 [Fontibacillus phaseoli]|uniref:Uncharacterized protein n=1 Tax=Fontibacillus phaseoli TaxID=1416533 RepID=A0A369BDR2_9BACL|nr:hypothetical protein [Fontibacillus phaseoli]RCX19699.1 hypothetical protein DFP94_104153 [Fontibacillus phaseoli]